MENDKLKRLYENFITLYNARGRDRLNFIKKTETYFTDILKLLITLSTAMIAFISITPLLGRIDISYKLIPIFGYFFTIILAILSYTLLILHYKRYVDKATKDEANLFKMWSSQNFTEVQKRIKKEEESFSAQKSGDWQWSTIILGILSGLSFLISVIIMTMLSFSSLDSSKKENDIKEKPITKQSSGLFPPPNGVGSSR